MDLAEWVAPGEVIGLDRSPEVIERAREAAEARELSNLSFEVGDVYNLEFEDSSFDVVYAHQVLQHLSDPTRALKRCDASCRRGMARRSRRGLRRVHVVAAERWSDAVDGVVPPDHAENDAEADAGRFLAGWVESAGFESLERSTSEWTYESVEEREWWADLWADRVLYSEFARQGLEYGLTTSEELSEISDAFRAWSDSAEGIFVVVHEEVWPASSQSSVGDVTRSMRRRLLRVEVRVVDESHDVSARVFERGDDDAVADVLGLFEQSAPLASASAMAGARRQRPSTSSGSRRISSVGTRPSS